MVAVIVAAGLLLLVAGLAKVRDPRSARDALRAARLPLAARARSPLVRAAGLLQAAAGASTLLLDRRPAGAVVAVAYLALTGFSWRLARVAPDAGCGCFGADDGPVRPQHLLVDLGLAAAGVTAVLLPAGRGLPAELAAQPWAGAPLVLGTAVLAYACYLLMTALPDLTAARTTSEATR